MKIEQATVPRSVDTWHDADVPRTLTARTAFVVCEPAPFGSGSQLAQSIDDTTGRLSCDGDLIAVTLAPVVLNGYGAGTSGVLVTAVVKVTTP